ncbi:MAG: adenylate/guanylate cyclase domain-containing protein [Spirochaetaceae bacterium]|jgi:adenylate cyclase|nr:adenylate/guanylate cyclase domain-containing protein [Spirochaetaceae bacterium]
MDHSGAYSARGFATYHIKVLMHSSSLEKALFIPFTTNRYRIFVNGRMVAEHGGVNSQYVDSTDWNPPRIVILPEQQVLDIVYQNANFDDVAGGILSAPRIGSFENLKKERDRASIFEAFLFGVLLITGLLYLSFYINKKDDRSSLYFGLFSIVLALRTIVYGEHLLLQVLSSLSMEMEFTLGHITLYLAIPLFLRFITLAYPMKVLNKMNLPLWIISALNVLLVLFTPHRFYIHFLVLYQVIAAVTGFTIFICLLLTTMKGNPSARTTLIGYIVLLVAGINDILYSQEIIHSFFMLHLGFTVFIMSQAALLSWNIGRAFSKSEELALELTSANSSFRRFVPEEFLRYLKKERISDMQLGDHVEMEMTVLFCDIRDFTSLSENMTPRENFMFLNSFLERIGPVIRGNQGFVDKYIGDGVMALFPGGPDCAVQAALKIEETLKLYNKHRLNSNYEPIRIGIGINTGFIMMGTIGENERMDSTVISDAVSACSRIESITKEYGLNIAISENTYSKLKMKDMLDVRNIGNIVLKGKKEPIGVYELYNGDDPVLIRKKNQLKKHFEAAVKSYERKDYEKSLSIFSKILDVFPEDETCHSFQAKIFQYLSNLAD